MRFANLRSHLNLPMVAGVLCSTIGAAALVVTLAQNASFGESLADSSRGQLISMGGSVIMDSFAAVLAIVFGIFLASRKWGFAVVAGIPMVLYIGYSMQSSFNYQMTERMAKAERIRGDAGEARRNVEAQNAALSKARADLVASYEGRQSEANRIAGDRRQPTARRNEARAEKKRLDEALRLLSDAPLALKQLPPAPDAVLADPSAEIIARWTGVSSDVVAASQIAALSIGLPLTKMLGFMFGSVLLHLGAERARQRLAMLQAAAESKAVKVEAPTEPERNVEDELAESVARVAAEAASVKDAALESIVTNPIGDNPVERAERLLIEQQSQINEVQAYLASATDAAASVKVPVRDFLKHYKAWCKSQDIDPAVTNVIMLGHILSAVGVPRVEETDRGGRRVYHVGRSLRHLDVAGEEAGLAVAA